MSDTEIFAVDVAEFIYKDLFPTGTNHFSEVEGNWLMKFMAEFCLIEGNRKITDNDISDDGSGKEEGSGKKRMSQSQVFKSRVIALFLRRFPYRDPEYEGDNYPEDLISKLQWDEEQRKSAPKRIYDWLQRRKPNEAKKSASAHRFKPNATPKGDYPSDHYKPNTDELRDEAKTLNMILNLSQDVHCALQPEVVEKFRENIGRHMDNLLRAVSRIGNFEIVTFGTWIEKDTAHTFQVATQRTRAFVLREQAETLRQDYRDYALAIVGPHLDVNQEEPPVTVYGNPDRDHAPMYPMSDAPPARRARYLDIWFNATWRRAGGQNDVPYDLLFEDSSQKVYALTDRARYPPNILVFESPYRMHVETMDAWINHVRNPGNEATAFQFLQPRPGIYDVTFRVETRQDALINYPAESMQYMNWICKLQQGRRDDELPSGTPGRQYIAFSSGQLEKVHDLLGESDSVLKDLITEASIYDTYLPVHAPQTTFTELQHLVPFFPNSLPRPRQHLNYLEILSGHYLPAQFWRARGGRGNPWALPNILKFVNAEEWRHEKSGTLMGGPYGVKWPMIVLFVLGINIENISRGTPVPEVLEGEAKVSMTVASKTAIYKAATTMLKEMRLSAQALADTLEDRTLTAADEPVGPAWLQVEAPQAPEEAPVEMMPMWEDEWAEREIVPQPAVAGGLFVEVTSRKRLAEAGNSPPTKRGRRSGGLNTKVENATAAARSRSRAGSQSPEALLSSVSSEEPPYSVGSEGSAEESNDSVDPSTSTKATKAKRKSSRRRSSRIVSQEPDAMEDDEQEE